ncbi:hypothetical protein COT51_00285 [candidate division WWE3 bacterium CG08_land_8_20_14_0_20_41_15]|uniref:Uncharacterized protein n=1 Tax=candidate division WWE3 bacterium CG08_land_8_20_14_0_20_41_15 TaxID=1975086 RepID=A0A2H0XAM5_UNCKA|nr:MAG: hypothetical protein COT51_00285 [candidate division WWE3 bacterium CG08_land_8_20_14_0_20_41_15]
MERLRAGIVQGELWVKTKPKMEVQILLPAQGWARIDEQFLRTQRMQEGQLDDLVPILSIFFALWEFRF